MAFSRGRADQGVVKGSGRVSSSRGRAEYPDIVRNQVPNLRILGPIPARPLHNPNLGLSSGDNTIFFAGENPPGNFLAVNLYFNGDLETNRITAVVATETTNFQVVSAGVNTFGLHGDQASSGSLQYTAGNTVTLSDLRTISYVRHRLSCARQSAEVLPDRPHPIRAGCGL